MLSLRAPTQCPRSLSWSSLCVYVHAGWIGFCLGRSATSSNALYATATHSHSLRVSRCSYLST